uniref:Uncharacterized protein n=1 Tax=Arundo donax TaxID=35708 RepID=A0A0A9H2P7_ARUDO
MLHAATPSSLRSDRSGARAIGFSPLCLSVRFCCRGASRITICHMGVFYGVSFDMPHFDRIRWGIS